MDFNNILIGSDNPQALVDYYTKLLGEPAMSDGGYTGWAIGRGFIAVGAHSEVHGRNTAPGRLIWNIATPDVKEIAAKFKAAGAIVVAEPYALEMEGFPTTWIATFEDPDGNYFQLQTPFEM